MRSKLKTFETLSGAAFMKMEPQEFAALSRDELARLAFRVRAIMAAIATYTKAVEGETTEMVKKFFDIQCEAELLSMKPQDIAALAKDELEQLLLRGQEILQRCPIKSGCRFCSLPDEYILHVLLEWLTIEDQARFDMALLNHMDRRAHLSLLRDTVHGGVLSVSGKRNAYGEEDGYEFNSGVCAWLESRNVFMRALRFQNCELDIPAGFLARTGQQLLKLDFSSCHRISDAELGKLFARCPRLEEVTLYWCPEITDVALECLAQQCPCIHTLNVSTFTQITGGGLARLGGSCRKIKKLDMNGLRAISDDELGKIAEMCPNLEDVNLRHCSSITDVGLLSLVRFCPHIYTLDLFGTKITGGCLASVGDAWRNMRTLSLSQPAISDAGLGKIAEMCPNLKEASLRYCSSITDVGLSSLLRLCPYIHTLELWGTQATAEGLASLRVAYPALRLAFCEV